MHESVPISKGLHSHILIHKLVCAPVFSFLIPTKNTMDTSVLSGHQSCVIKNIGDTILEGRGVYRGSMMTVCNYVKGPCIYMKVSFTTSTPTAHPPSLRRHRIVLT